MTNSRVEQQGQSSSIKRWRLYSWIMLHLLVIILLPFLLLESQILVWGQSFLASEPTIRLLAVMVVLALTLDVLLPIPASLVSLAATILIGGPLGAATLFIGLMCGSIFGYYVGYAARSKLLSRILSPETRTQLNLLGEGNAWLALILARPVPVLAEASVILAGLERFPVGRFLQISIVANAFVMALYAVTVSAVIP